MTITAPGFTLTDTEFVAPPWELALPLPPLRTPAQVRRDHGPEPLADASFAGVPCCVFRNYWTDTGEATGGISILFPPFALMTIDPPQADGFALAACRIRPPLAASAIWLCEYDDDDCHELDAESLFRLLLHLAGMGEGEQR